MEIITIILQGFIAIIVTALTAIVGTLGKAYAEMLLNRIEDQKKKDAIKQGLQILAASVGSVQQTYVDELKAQDKFDKDAQIAALTKAKNQAMDLMNKQVKEALASQYGDVDAFMNTFIENLIAQNK